MTSRDLRAQIDEAIDALLAEHDPNRTEPVEFREAPTMQDWGGSLFRCQPRDRGRRICATPSGGFAGIGAFAVAIDSSTDGRCRIRFHKTCVSTHRTTAYHREHQPRLALCDSVS